MRSEPCRVGTVGTPLAQKEQMVPKWFREHHCQEYSRIDLPGDETRGEKEEAKSQCRDYPGAGNRSCRSGAATAIERPAERIGPVCSLPAATERQRVLQR